MEAGKLRHQVRIERLDYLRDETGAVLQNPSTGETAQDWVEVATVWASIEPLSAREFIASAKTQAEIVARIVIRHRDGLDASMRLVHVRTGRPDVVYNPADFLPDKESGHSRGRAAALADACGASVLYVAGIKGEGVALSERALALCPKCIVAKREGSP